MTPKEARALTIEEFDAMDAMDISEIADDAWDAIRPEVKRSCSDCGHLKAVYISWWCMSDQAREHRGTRIPGINRCIFWKEQPPPSVVAAPLVAAPLGWVASVMSWFGL